MAKIKIPVTWEMSGFVEVNADSIEAGINYFEENSDRIPLPENGEYVDGSFALSCDEPEFVALYNQGKNK